jgi:hypothetical protein
VIPPQLRSCLRIGESIGVPDFPRSTPARDPPLWVCRSQAGYVYSGTPVIDAVVRVSANSASSSSKSRRKDASDCAGLSRIVAFFELA